LTDVQGDGKFPGGRKSFEGSGIRGADVPTGRGIAGGKSSYDLKFTKASSDKGYRYPCTIHGSFMDGRIVVPN
jgi:plastocyanin